MSAGGDVVQVMNCDEALQCRVDILALDGELVGTVPYPAAETSYGPGLVSVSGHLATMQFDQEGSATVLIDGGVVLEDPTGYGGGIAWSPDGRWLVVWIANDLVLIDRTSMERHQVPYEVADLENWPLIVFDG
jgi:hypothetical protein